MGFGLKNYPNGLENRRAFGDSLLLLVSLNKAMEIVKKVSNGVPPYPQVILLLKSFAGHWGWGELLNNSPNLFVSIVY